MLVWETTGSLVATVFPHAVVRGTVAVLPNAGIAGRHPSRLQLCASS
jgi:hypothetical protein